MNKDRAVQLTVNKDSYGITFNAMASPCEVIIQSTDKQLAAKLGEIIATEVWRIEDKYSRYNQRSVCSVINNNAGQSVTIDEETYLLLNFAEQCYQLSEGLFDISSGVLRKTWSFQGIQSSQSSQSDNSNFPTEAQVKQNLTHVGWRKIHFDQKQIRLVKGMEIDFGGIGKEYAVDRAIILAKQLTNRPVLVNLGGDLAVTCSRVNNEPWQVAIEHPDSDNNITDMIVSLKSGALATSGDARRFLINDGKRYGHILNAKTGWPVEQAPRSITVVAPQCIQAGILATLALLQGAHAEQFLKEQEIKFWARR